MLSSVNLYGTWTLYCKEVRRFLKVYNQTLVAPTVTALLFLAIFSLAIGDRINMVGDLSFQEFMAAGLIMMSVVQQAFANTSSSLTMGKVLGTFIDYLMPPLSPGELVFAWVMAAVTRGVLMAIMVGLAIRIFVPIGIYDFGAALFFLIFASMFMALCGILAGIISETFDHMSAITSYIITPLAFLSGTFYSIERLPDFWYHVTHFNPFFYMIDGFRYGLTGHTDGDITTGMLTMLGLNIALWAFCYSLLKRGYRIKT